MKQKSKVLKKVKLHHKKKAKEAKKLGFKSSKPTTKADKKDPGVPNDWPLKEQERKSLEARRARAVEELEQKKAARIVRVLFHFTYHCELPLKCHYGLFGIPIPSFGIGARIGLYTIPSVGIVNAIFFFNSNSKAQICVPKTLVI